MAAGELYLDIGQQFREGRLVVQPAGPTTVTSTKLSSASPLGDLILNCQLKLGVWRSWEYRVVRRGIVC